MNNIFKFITVVAFVVAVLALILAVSTPKLGGTTNYDALDVTDGYSVDGTTVIDGSGNVDATITSDTGTFSSTLGVTGALTGTSASFSTTLGVVGETQLSTLIQGGSVLSLATSTAGARTLTAAEVCNNSVIRQQDWAGTASGTVTLTLPTATLLYADCLNTQGDSKQILFTNAASAAASTTQIVAGTNIVLTESDNGADADVLIGGTGGALITITRVGATATSSGIYAHVEEIRGG